MEERIRKMKEKQKIRRELLAKQLGVGGADKLSDALGGSSDVIDDKKPSSEETFYAKICKIDSSAAGADFARTADKNDDETQVEVYKDSSTFLKGTQSLNPHNDYCQNYVDTGQRPQNFIRDVGLAERFGEYPKLKELIRLKDEVIRTTNTPPAYFKCDLKDKFDFRQLGCKFDVILLEPPLVEYRKQAGLPLTGAEMTWDDVIAMDIETAAAQRSFIFLWCGSCEGLDFGRRCLKRWGYRRCEDICWIKTNLKKQTQPLFDDSLFVHTKEHCLMGIHGTVRRSTDGDFIHANVDIDLIIDEEAEPGSSEKPEEIFHIIEHFCLGRRRLHLFGRDTSIRPGWLTVGPQLTASNFDKETYNNHFRPTPEMPNAHVTGCTDEIERLRPKTPPPRGEKKAADGGRGGQAAGGRGRNNSNRGTSIPRANLTPRVDQGAAPAPQNWHGGASGNPQISANLTAPFFDQRGAGDGRNAVPRKRDLSWDRSGGGGGRRGGMRPNHRGGQRGGGGNPNC